MNPTAKAWCRKKKAQNGRRWREELGTYTSVLSPGTYEVQRKYLKAEWTGDFPGSPVVKNPPYNAGDSGSIPGQGTKDPTCHGATKLTCHNYWARMPQLESLRAANYRAHEPWSLRTTTREKLVHRNKEPEHHNERSRMPQQRSHVPQLRPDTAKNKLNK